MSDVKLRPLVRRALFALFVEGRPLSLRRDFRRLGLHLTQAHHEQLASQGLATLSGEPERSYEITAAGRDWVADQTVEALIEAVEEMPALRAVRLRAALSLGVAAAPALEAEPAPPAPAPAPLAAAPPAPEPSGDPVAEQAWRLADQELARALQEVPRLKEAARLKDLLPRELRAAIGDAATFLRSAAEKRRMALVGEPGQTSEFDEDVHSRDDPRVGPGVRLRVQRPGVRQGSEEGGRMILKADVEPLDQVTE